MSSTLRSFLRSSLIHRTYSVEEPIRHLRNQVNLTATPAVDPSRMANLRNDLAHGKAEPDTHELRQAYEEAQTLARRVVLTQLDLAPGTA